MVTVEEPLGAPDDNPKDAAAFAGKTGPLRRILASKHSPQRNPSSPASRPRKMISICPSLPALYQIRTRQWSLKDGIM